MVASTEVGWSPTTRIELIAGTPQGGGQDRAARALASALESVVDVPISVSNIPGLGGGNAWTDLAGHGGDGHWLSISSPTLITNRLTGLAELGLGDVTQLALLCTEYIAFTVPTASKLSTAADLLSWLATDQQPIVSLATARGNITHIAVGYLCRHLGIDPRHVEIRVHDSAPHAINDVLAHGAGVAAVSAASVIPGLLDGSLRILASSAPVRLGEHVDSAPTWGELGVDCTIGTWRGVVGPPALPDEVMSFWNGALRTAAASSSWHAEVERYAWTSTFLDSTETERFMLREEIDMGNALHLLRLPRDHG